MSFNPTKKIPVRKSTRSVSTLLSAEAYKTYLEVMSDSGLTSAELLREIVDFALSSMKK